MTTATGRSLTRIDHPPCPVKRTGWEEYLDDGLTLVEYEGEDDRTYVCARDERTKIWYVLEERRTATRGPKKK